jgi:hypothetical protein
MLRFCHINILKLKANTIQYLNYTIQYNFLSQGTNAFQESQENKGYLGFYYVQAPDCIDQPT